jgi:benzoyl-CoA reductase/2-hydroxyglutaryl-CoA dehydratase subunit BcrC/BadD/HgdB
LRTLDELRADSAPGISASRLLDLVALAWLLDPEQAVAMAEAARGERSASRPARPRLMVGGSLLAEGDHWLLELVEQKADIVADFLCTGSRSFAEDATVTPDPMQGLAEFYYSRVPCMQRRPNDALYDYVRRLAGTRRVDGILYKTLLYCDPWNFEARRLKTTLGLPLLHLDTDYSKEHREQVRTRVEAFLEML